MSRLACRANQELGAEAIRLILEDGNSVFLVDDMSISRMLVCGKCPDSSIDYEDSKKAFQSSMTVLATKIDNYNEWGFDPEISVGKRTESGKKYRESNKEKIREKAQSYRVEARIKKLKEGNNG